jgi:sugar phosphate isomerase/epimerase
MKLAFSTLGCPDWTLKEIVESAASLGYDGVDFRGLLDEIDISKRTEFTTGLAGTRRLFADHGVAVSGVLISARYAVVDPAERQRQFDETRRNLALAAALDAPVLRVYGGAVPEGYTVDTILPTLVDNLQQMGDEADGYGVTLALETHDAWTDSAVFARLMRAVDHPRVRVLWDLHHPFRQNGETPDVTYANIGAYVANIHVKDSVPADDGHTLVLVGEGDVPLQRMLTLLEQGGYDGYASLESEKRWHPELAEPGVAFPQYVAKMRAWGFA